MPRQHTTNDPEYRKARKQLLANNPLCHWCGTAPATTADHLIEIDRGGDHTTLVPACHPCNSRRGQRYKATRDAQRKHTRHEAIRQAGIINTSNENVFLGTHTPPPTQCLSIPEDPNQPELVVLGSDQPRLKTIAPDAAGTYAIAVRDWAKDHLQVDLMGWQYTALELQLLHDDAGDLLHRVSLVSTARQNGKTVALTALVGWWLTEFAILRGTKQNVLSTSNRLDLAVGLFDELAPILEVKFGAEIVRSYGRNSVTMPDGSRWIIRAAKPSVGHGTSNDLIVADEIWDISPIAIDGGLIPSQRARKSPLLSMWSTAGTEASQSMLRFREQGLRAIDQGIPTTFAMCEWSPPPDVDPMSPSSWHWGNPALGHTLTMETIQAESENPDRAQFLRASCNLWVASDRGWLPPGLWPQLQTDEPLPAGGVVAIETSMDDSRYFGVRAVALPDRKIAVTVEFVVESFAQCLIEIERLAGNPSIKFAVSPSIDIHMPLKLAARKVVVGYGELLKFTPSVRSMIHEKMVRHDGSAQLAEHIQRAVAVRSESSIALSSQRSPGPIELARCAVWAIALAGRAQPTGKPQVFVTNR